MGHAHDESVRLQTIRLPTTVTSTDHCVDSSHRVRYLSSQSATMPLCCVAPRRVTVWGACNDPSFIKARHPLSNCRKSCTA